MVDASARDSFQLKHGDFVSSTIIHRGGPSTHRPRRAQHVFGLLVNTRKVLLTFRSSASGLVWCGAATMRSRIGWFRSRAYIGILRATYSRTPPMCGHESDVEIMAFI